MSVNVSSFGPKPQFELADGTPAVGNKLFFYVAGSVNTKQNTYTDSTGGSANTNPIVLNSLGQPTSQIWFTTGQSYKVVYAPSTDTDPPTSPIWTIDNLVGINDTTVTIDQWVVGPAPTYVGATSFTLVGDQTSAFHVGRRLKTTNSGGTIYSTIVTTVFGALTTVTVVNDAGVLDSGLSAVRYGLLTAANPSTPLLADTYPIASGSSDKTKKVRLEADGLTTATTRVITMPDYDVTLGNMPAGVVMDYAGSSVPTGWLECDGSAVSRTTYANLFTNIATTWGAGDTVTTFNVPDFRDKARIGKGTGTVVESVTNAAINTGTDVVTVASNNTKWTTGMLVAWTVSGTPPTTNPANLLDNADTVYVIRTGATTIKFATTLANAQNGTAIDITAAGAGTFTMTHTYTARALGEVGGEESHAMSSTESLAHTHLQDGSTVTNVAGGTLIAGATVAVALGGTAQSSGGNAAMNIMGPFAVTMAIIKT